MLEAFTFALSALAYASIAAGLSLLLGSLAPDRNTLIVGVSLTLFTIIYIPIHPRLKQWVSRAYQPKRGPFHDSLASFSRELARAAELPAIVTLIRRYIERAYNPSQLHLFIHDPLREEYVAAHGDAGQPSTDIRFPETSALIQALVNQKDAIILNKPGAAIRAIHSEKNRLAILGIQVLIPLHGQNSLPGWIGLGSPHSGNHYRSQDIRYLESLADLAALAIERLQAIASLERRKHEMDILTRIIQGINITLAFDDILELIYAQTTNLIPGSDFRIALRDNFSGQLYDVFYLEGDERIHSRENLPLPVDQGLEYEVMESRRLLITDDYEHECHKRGILPAAQGRFAWIGVPLNAGGETIGVVSLDSRDPSVKYTSEQGYLLQAIADQAAGAMVKAQLLQETQRRAQQLALLNEVAQSLTSTLDLNPLLNQILNSAMEILDCEAGSLLMLDNNTRELVFEVAVGPVAKELVGKRMPPGKGLVGTSIETRSAIIANNVRDREDWFKQTDEQTGFHTEHVLVVPLEVKGRVIGVIEAINKRDSLPFNESDKSLLTAFANQAAVAIENARLYTLTDQALTARVEELSVMQRIDQELNASLDVNHAMRMTLTWAMRQSGAEAGLIGVVEEKGLRLAATEGYREELEAYEDNFIPLTIPAVRESIRTGLPGCQYFSNEDPTHGILRGARGQIAVPIRRESKMIGLILLETTRTGAFPQEIQDFLSRLSDHAAIAIANAQLYAAVEAANTAKSEFVSFVSHELKTPMTSIKGFTDLLAAGVVGPINENQANFLSTIRSNVDRMATLVSDLADISRIEAGR